jgi:hypothetical protein
MSPFTPNRRAAIAILMMGVALVSACKDVVSVEVEETDTEADEARFDSAVWDEATFGP